MCFLFQLMEIEDPVEDSKGYVYERHDVVFYIQSNQGRVKCPATGKFGKYYIVTRICCHGKCCLTPALSLSR